VRQGLAEPGIPGFGSLHERHEGQPAELAAFGCGLGA